MPEKCHVIKCNHAAIAQGLCSTHYKRKSRHGDVDAGRPDDWGSRNKHPSYKSWCGLRRCHRALMPEEWKEDFWRFANDVPCKPDNGKACRHDKSIPWSKDNFYWKTTRSSSAEFKDYMRDWHKKSRDANPDYYKNIYLKKQYGVTIEWYQETLAKQNCLCAICNKPEISSIKGKLLSLAVDHCHDTGGARGLLCRACNNAIGALKHDVAILESAIGYLKKHNSLLAEN